MPDKSPYQIELSPEEEQVLRQTAARYTLPYYQVIRAKMILLAAQGLPNQEIADRLDVCRKTVSKWRKRFFDERLAGLQERARPGRPAAFSPSDRGAGEGTGM